MLIVGIDVGNYDTKTQNTTISSGYSGPLYEKPLGDDYLMYNGKYYIPSTERFAYEKDKTRSERCLILSLFALANEIYYRVMRSNENVNKNQQNVQSLINNVYEVGIGVGVPPTHYVKPRVEELMAYYKKYMSNGIEFEWKGFKFSLRLKALRVYPQGGAGSSDPENTFAAEYPGGYYVIDIGGYTVDTIKYGKDGKTDGKWSSKENGVIVLYDRIISRAQGDHDVTLDYDVIEAVIKGEKTPLSITCPDAEETIRKMTADYVNNIIDTERQLGVEFKSYPCLFMGGGSLLFKDYILKNPLIYPKITLFLSSANANARGYATFLEMETGAKR